MVMSLVGQAREVVFILRRLFEQATEWQIPILSWTAMLQLLLIMSLAVGSSTPWSCSQRGSEKTGDQTRSSSWMKSCLWDFVARVNAAGVFGAALDFPAAAYCEMCQSRKWVL